MKFIDEKGRLFGKVNLFDLLILVLVLAGIVGMATRLLLPGAKPEELCTATYTVEFNEVEECFTDAFEKGDSLYQEGVCLGTVTDVKVSLAKTVEILPDGSHGLVEHVATYDVLLTVTTDRFRTSGGYHIDSQEMLAGTSHEISNGFARGTAVVREVIYE